MLMTKLLSSFRVIVFNCRRILFFVALYSLLRGVVFSSSWGRVPFFVASCSLRRGVVFSSSLRRVLFVVASCSLLRGVVFCSLWCRILFFVASCSLLRGVDIAHNLSAVNFTAIFMDFSHMVQKKNDEERERAWVGSLATALAHILSPLAAKLINSFGARPCTIVGSIVAAVGLISTSFVDCIDLMYFTYSILFAVGVSLTFTANFDIVPKYFKKKISVATGLLASGFGIAFLVMSPILETLLTHVGWRNTYRALSGMALLMCLSGGFYSPHVQKDFEPKTHRRAAVLQDSVKRASLFRNGRFIICCLSTGFIYHLGITIPIVHMSRYAQDSGLTPSQGANLYIGFGVFSVIGRVLSGKICSLKSVKSYFVCFIASFFMGTSVLVCPLVDGFIGLLVFFSVYGLCDGFYATSNFVLVMESCSRYQSTRGYGWFFFSMSFGLASGPPLGGFIADQVGSYVPVFYTSGSIIVFSAFLLLSITCCKQQNLEEGRTALALITDDNTIVSERLTVL